MRQLVADFKKAMLGLGNEVEENKTRSYSGFWHQGDTWRIFAFVRYKPDMITANVRPPLPLDDDFVVEIDEKICCRQIKIRNQADLERAEPLLRRCYSFR